MAGRRKPSKRAARSSNRAVMALAVLGAFVVLYGWNAVLLAPRSRAEASVKKQLSAARTQADELRQNLADLRKLAADSEGREAELARLGRLVPAGPDMAGAITALDDTAAAAQVDWTSLNPTPPGPATVGGPVGISLTIQVGGTFDQIFDYLRRLESLDRLVVVDSLALTATGTAGGSPKLEADLKARIFAAAPTASTTPATAPAAPVTALTKAGG
ncbi:MAG TPA: type 4a pilus biogenesis protein PilO [Acidimicrobiia bacterium]|nr:type 4a pilus biogenesis protein PilO [Acidimicrobiia bacterium]